MIRALTAELAKWRRTSFLLVTLGAALAGPLLTLLIFLNRPEGAPGWDKVAEQVLTFTLIMTGPLIATLIGAQLIAAEYQWDTWKLSLTAPVSRGAVYLAKWLISVAWMLGLMFIVYLGALGDGLLLGATGPVQLGFWAGTYLIGGLGLCVMLSVYHLITLFSQSFFMTSGVGIVATFAGIIAVQSKYIGLYPVSAVLAVSEVAQGHHPEGAPGSLPVWLTIQGATALVCLLASLIYVKKADYR